MVIIAVVAAVAIAIGIVNSPAGLSPVPRLTTSAAVKARRSTLLCKNRHKDADCDYWAATGGCEETPGWMAVYCGASCGDCSMLNPEIRCDADRIGYKPVAAFQPGSISKLFESLPSRFPQYNVTYLSRPPTGPYVVSFSNFLSDEEVDAMIDKAGDLRRSTDQGSVDEDGVQEQVKSQGRTSENAWCDADCESDPLVEGVSNRISQVTQIPPSHFESFQVLRYQNGQEYKRHHDMSEEDNNILCGARILTFFLYLSDVEEGGGTRFTDMDNPVTMQPVRGSAILWPSVLDEDPTKQDPLTHHQALPVTKGVKFAANHWIHQYDYRTPNLWGCTGSFTEVET